MEVWLNFSYRCRKDDQSWSGEPGFTCSSKKVFCNVVIVKRDGNKEVTAHSAFSEYTVSTHTYGLYYRLPFSHHSCFCLSRRAANEPRLCISMGKTLVFLFVSAVDAGFAFLALRALTPPPFPLLHLPSLFSIVFLLHLNLRPG